MIPARLLSILRSCESGATSHFPPTEIFNEGWMLRLVLDAIQTAGLTDFSLRFAPGARWYSEALLASPFRPRMRGDALGEGFTNADAVVGHFTFDAKTRAGVRLAPGAGQFSVVEAKMFSNLSAGTTRAKLYDQAARNVACMAHALADAGMRPADFTHLSFFVVAPVLARRQSGTNLEACVDPASIRQAVHQRIVSYEDVSRAEAAELRRWEADHFLPLVERLEATNSLGVLSWEHCIAAVAAKDTVAGTELQAFYDRCLSHEPQMVTR